MTRTKKCVTCRDMYWGSHAFRFDARTQEILNVAIESHVRPLGSVEDVPIDEHLLLVARAIQHAILVWIAPKRPVLKANKQLVFWGQVQTARLLTQALRQLDLAPIPNVEVPIRYEIDCRLFYDRDDKPYLGIVADVRTSNVIDVAVSELLARDFPIIGRGVCRRVEPKDPNLHPRLEFLGTVADVAGSALHLTDADADWEVDAGDVLIEPRLEALRDVITCYYPAPANDILSALSDLRQPILSTEGKLEQIRHTLAGLRGHDLAFADDVKVTIGDLLTLESPRFPLQIETARPPLLFGAQGHNVGQYPDAGIRTWGPYMYAHHRRNSPLIGVVCEKRHRGEVEQFVRLLRDGYPDEQWKNEKTVNPYRGGLIGKFRMTGARIMCEDAEDASAESYRRAARRLLGRLPSPPDIVLVQTREEFKPLRGDANPYFATKATFMGAGIPTQAIQMDKIASLPENIPYILNTMAVATYAKLDGIPWVMTSVQTTSHELVIGIGSSEVRHGRTGGTERYVGITTVFQSDGRYLVWGLTREVPFEEYPEALLTSLRMVLEYARQHNNWQRGDVVRLVFHVYKRLRDCEVEATKKLVQELLADTFSVQYAFLDISSFHPYRVFAPQQQGRQNRRGHIRGRAVPDRGTCLILDRRRALLQLTGPTDLKTDEQGMPVPLLLELHPDSDFQDIVYLARQAFHFTYASWQGFTPATDPVTIKYSQLIATLLGNLRHVTGWDSTVLSVGSLRDRCWFL